ncbi:BatD family protein [Ferrimonas balearica]|uniref:BatD family protein n=1 Tax=Ferrimonas balearica TaxID=44012 RepID=UPI001C98E9CB|nr:BatD family protein [Ferrimonas balearica]MBY5922103.1 BatD family protein [Ferrimonas balearica]MBY5994557.1 BatD family protein [Ferrimonas balearica]
MSPTFTRLLTAMILMVGLIPTARALSQLEASVDQNPVVAGQSFILEVVADDDIDSNELDTSALLRDFAVGQTRVSRSTQIINFDARRETRWTVMLIAREPGSATIPALDINGVRSQPITLTVLATDDPKVEAQSPLVYLETDLDTPTLWLGQPVKATVRLFLGADLQRGALNAPTADNALIRQLGQDRESSQIVNGRRYRIIERDYVIVPQTTGQLRLQPANFEGDVLVPTGRRDLFGRAQPRPMAIQGEPINLTIKPRPASYQGDWLAADLVTLSDSLDEQSEYQVGQPITRTLTLTAVGAVEESLAEISVVVPDALRIYPDKAQRQSGVQNGQLIARLEQTMAIVPAQPGTYILPEIKVPWWNARLGRQQWATLPAKTLTITGSAPAPVIEANLPDTAPQPQVVIEEVSRPGFWPWLTALFALLWLMTLAWGWRRGQRSANQPPESASTAPTTSSLKPLLKACQRNDVEATLALLPEWASEREGEPLSLAQIAERYPGLATHLQTLQRSQYSARTAAWSGKDLEQAIRTLGEKAKDAQDNALPPLNPPTRIKV